MIAEVELLAGCVAARAALAQGRDAEGFKAAQLVGGVGTSLWWCGKGGGRGGLRRPAPARVLCSDVLLSAVGSLIQGCFVSKAGCGMDVGLLH